MTSIVGNGEAGLPRRSLAARARRWVVDRWNGHLAVHRVQTVERESVDRGVDHDDVSIVENGAADGPPGAPGGAHVVAQAPHVGPEDVYDFLHKFPLEVEEDLEARRKNGERVTLWYGGPVGPDYRDMAHLASGAATEREKAVANAAWLQQKERWREQHGIAVEDDPFPDELF